MKTSDLPERCLSALEKRFQPELFSALCDPVRLALVSRLAASGSAITVTEASESCGIHFSGVSRHLTILRRAGVVRADKRGREVCYELEVDELASRLRGLADALEACARHCVPRAEKEKEAAPSPLETRAR